MHTNNNIFVNYSTQIPRLAEVSNTSISLFLHVICHLTQKGNNKQKKPTFIQQIENLLRLLCLVKLWSKFKDLKPARQGTTLVMSLQGKALDTIVKLDEKDVLLKDSITTTINNSLCKKDEYNKKLKDLLHFESCWRSLETEMYLTQNLIKYRTD